MTNSKARYLAKFEEHLEQAEHPKKAYPTRMLHALLAQIYYNLFQNAPNI